jgi:putative acetyltransferase
VTRGNFTVREAQTNDNAAINAVHCAAFDTDGEAGLAEALRTDGEVAIELLAEQAGQVVGMVLLSDLQAPTGTLALAPIAVLPECQGKGIGATLIRAAIARARGIACPAIFLLGEPSYYERFGFSVADAMPFDSPYPSAHMMVLMLRREDPSLSGGPIIYLTAFAEL